MISINGHMYLVVDLTTEVEDSGRCFYLLSWGSHICR